MDFFSLVLIIFLLAVPGCSTLSRQSGTVGVFDSQTALPSAETYRRLAAQYETSQRLPGALLAWRVVATINPGDGTAKERIAQLTETMQREGNLHFAKGKECLNRKSFQTARQEFALALAHNPSMEGAADYLRRLSFEDEFIEYSVRTGDSPERIAQTVYHDRNRQSIVTYFADAANDRELKSGRILRLPAAEQETKTKVVRLSKPYKPNNEAPRTYDKAGAEVRYNKGVAFYLVQQFREAIREWEETLHLDPEHPNAKRDLQKARAMLRRARLK